MKGIDLSRFPSLYFKLMVSKFQSIPHPCICGKTANSYPTMKRHRRNCSDWKNRDVKEIKIRNHELTLMERYGTSDLKKIPGYRVPKEKVKTDKVKYENIDVHKIRGINHLETKNKFGYSPIEIPNKSKKKIIAKCDFCTNDFETTLPVLSKHEYNACKQCDAIASVYSRLNSSEDKHEFYLKRRPEINLSKININLTMEKFNYHPKDVSQYSNKKIIAKCDYCQCDIEMVMSKFTSKMEKISCRKCMRKKTVETLQSKYGVSNTLDIPGMEAKLANPLTERIVENVLKSRYKIDYIRSHSVGPYSFDFYVPSINLLIECQGDYFHKFKEFGYSGTPKDRIKSSFVENQTNHKLVWIYEHEIHIGRINKILDYHIYGVTEPTIEFDLKQLTFSKITQVEAHNFLSQYHYLGNLGTVASPFGAYFNGLLVAVCVFGGVTRNQSIKKVNSAIGSSFGPKDIRELRRFCIRPNITVKNLASFSMKRFINLHHETSPEMKAVLSFSDPNVEDIGTIYKASNWISMKDAVSSYHYLDPNTNRMIHKKTVWDMAKGAHISENEFAAISGLKRVNEIAKHTWLKIL